MPALIEARDNHSSIAVNKNLYAFGGYNNEREFLPSVEILDLVRNSQKLLEHPKVARCYASVTLINHEKVAVFGGIKKSQTNDGYLINLRTQQFTPILGKDIDFKFECFTQTQWVGSNRHITLGRSV